MTGKGLSQRGREQAEEPSRARADAQPCSTVSGLGFVLVGSKARFVEQRYRDIQLPKGEGTERLPSVHLSKEIKCIQTEASFPGSTGLGDAGQAEALGQHGADDSSAHGPRRQASSRSPRSPPPRHGYEWTCCRKAQSSPKSRHRSAAGKVASLLSGQEAWAPRPGAAPERLQ